MRMHIHDRVQSHVQSVNEHAGVNKGGHEYMTRCPVQPYAAIRNQQSGAGVAPNLESQSDGLNSTRRRCTRSQSHGRNSTRRRCTRYTLIAHAQHTIARMSTAPTSTAATTQPIFRTCEGQAHGLGRRIPSGKAGRGCRRVPQRQKPAQPYTASPST